MTEEEIIEGNKLIAEFMGVPIDTETFSYPTYSTMNGEYYDDQLEYNSSWDWLMPVVENIESIKDEHHGFFGVHISSNNCTIQATNFRPDKPIANPPYYFSDHTLETKIISTWFAVVQFIKWYNQNHP